MAIRKIVSRSILDGAIAPVDTTGVATPTTLTVSGITTFPELDNIQVTAPNRHSVDPTLILDFANSKTLDPRITFTRGSSATYYDGTTAMAEQNLLLRSQDWSASWGFNSSATTITANSTAAPDGTTTATQFSIARTTSELHYSEQSVNNLGGPVTVSAYFKANTHNFLTLAVYQVGFGNAYSVAFNLSTGAITKTTSAGSVFGVSSTITSVGNSWYRVTVTAAFPSTAPTYMIFATNSVSVPTYNYQGILESYAGTVGNSFYVWGAQMENRSSPTAYTPTTTTAITNYIPVLKTAGPNQARFDVDPITLESKGLLVEEQRTNLLTYSSELTNTGWAAQGVTVRINSTIAPDGTQTAATVSASSTSESQNIAGLHNSPAGFSTFSIFAKAAGYQYVQCYQSRSAGGDVGYVTFDLNTGTVTNSSVWTGSVVSVGNGWYRLIATTSSLTGVSNSSNARWQLTDGTASRAPAFQGNSFNGAYFWGAQVEAGAFPTSYIPTSASTVTRNFDYPVISGSNFSSWFNNTAGTVYVEATAALNAATGGAPFVYLIDSAQGSQNDLYLDTDSGNARFYAWDRGSAVVSMNLSTVTAGTSYKVAGTYKLNDYAASKNGGAVVTDTSATVPANLSQMIIGRDIFNALSLNSTIKKIAYYPIRLTNAELIGMTTA